MASLGLSNNKHFLKDHPPSDILVIFEIRTWSYMVKKHKDMERGKKIIKFFDKYIIKIKENEEQESDATFFRQPFCFCWGPMILLITG